MRKSLKAILYNFSKVIILFPHYLSYLVWFGENVEFVILPFTLFIAKNINIDGRRLEG